MRHIVILICISLFTVKGIAQNITYGIMGNLTNTTFDVATGEVSINQNGELSTHTRNTGFELNTAIGVYGLFKIDERYHIGVELFYDKTTSTELKGVEVTSYNFMPYCRTNIIQEYFQLDIGIGLGFSNELNFIGIGAPEVEKTDLIAKVGLASKISKFVYLELGAYPSITWLLEDSMKRTRLYLGVKLPLNMYFKK